MSGQSISVLTLEALSAVVSVVLSTAKPMSAVACIVFEVCPLLVSMCRLQLPRMGTLMGRSCTVLTTTCVSRCSLSGAVGVNPSDWKSKLSWHIGAGMPAGGQQTSVPPPQPEGGTLKLLPPSRPGMSVGPALPMKSNMLAVART